MTEKVFLSHRSVRHGVVSASVLMLAAALFAALATGCKRSDEAPTGQPTGSFKYPEELSAQSTPEEVATLLLKALDEEDQQTLLGLVAVQAEAEAVDAIYRKYGRKSDAKPEAVAAMAAAGWAASYAFLEKGATKVESSSVEGDSAAVIASGKRLAGASSSLKIKLIREEGLWKVRAGLESIAE